MENISNSNEQRDVAGTQEVVDSGSQSTSTNNEPTAPELTPEQLRDALSKARAEAAKYRLQVKEHKDTMTAKEQEELKALEEANNFKALYEKTTSKLSTYEQEREQLLEKAKIYDELMENKRNTLLQSAPKELQSTLADLSIEKIEEILKNLPQAKPIDSPNANINRGGGNQTPQFTQRSKSQIIMDLIPKLK